MIARASFAFALLVLQAPVCLAGKVCTDTAYCRTISACQYCDKEYVDDTYGVCKSLPDESCCTMYDDSMGMCDGKTDTCTSSTSCDQECYDNDDCSSKCCTARLTYNECQVLGKMADGDVCFSFDGCDCESGVCEDDYSSKLGLGRCVYAPPSPKPTPKPVCHKGTHVCDDPHMLGLSGQRIDWHGEDGGWYCLFKDGDDGVQINVRLTAPLPVEFPNRQLMTGLAIFSGENRLVIEVKDAYSVATDGCSPDASPCLADGGLRITFNGKELQGLVSPVRNKYLANQIYMSASNLPVECRQFGGDKIWAEMYHEMRQGSRQLQLQTFEDWMLGYEEMVAHGWCTKYIAERGLENVQSNYGLFKITTSDITVRLHVGVAHQTNDDLDWDGRALPEMDFWQMDIGLAGMDIENPHLSGLLGETAHPVMGEDGQAVMEGPDAIRGTVEDYRVSGADGTDFALLHTNA